MPYMLIHFWPEATEANYQAEIAAVHPPGGLPEGQTVKGGRILGQWGGVKTGH